MKNFVSIFLCCVTLLELVGKKTFGLNTVSFQGQESKCFSLFFKVKEGIFKRQLHDRSNSFCILPRNLLVLDKKSIVTPFACQAKSKEYFIFYLVSFAT